MREQGAMVHHFLGENEIIRGVRERPGPAVREISSGVYENSPREPRVCRLKASGSSPNGLPLSSPFPNY